MAPTILIVDDEKNLRTTLTRIFEKENFDVTTAANANEALKFLEAGAFDLAFVDLMMPGMDGLTLTKEIRSQYPDMPVLILTANATLDSAIEAVRQGARDYLIKPADPPRMVARVKEILSEQTQPKRQREILTQIQMLASELQQIDESTDSMSPTLLSTLPPTDPSRFLQRGPFTLDLHARHLMMENNFVPLSPSNFDYMVTLVRHCPNPITYEGMVKESQGYDLTRQEAREMARWRIHELRKALEPDPKNPQFIITVRGSGYRLVI
jgi:two-component system alkaline phosphatase synthesis response regulator PhoP